MVNKFSSTNECVEVIFGRWDIHAKKDHMTMACQLPYYNTEYHNQVMEGHYHPPDRGRLIQESPDQTIFSYS